MTDNSPLEQAARAVEAARAAVKTRRDEHIRGQAGFSEVQQAEVELSRALDALDRLQIR